MSTQTVTIRYRVDSSGAFVATGQVIKTVTQVGQAATGANKALAAQQQQIRSLQGALNSYTQGVRQLFTVYLSFQGLTTFAAFADEYKNLNGRLAVVITNTQQYAQAQRDVYAIAQSTYSSLSATANLYARLAVSLEELNSSQQEVALITRTINQSLLVSGATSAEASSAIVQLSQSFASGVLRGEEFNAVNEASPRIMAALAKSLGVSRGALRELASEGVLTAEVLRKALVEDAANIAKEAENVPLTIGRGWTTLRNDLLKFVGAVDETYGASRKLAEGLVYVGQNLIEITNAAGTALTAVAAFAGVKGLGGLVIAAARAYQAGTLLSTVFLAFGGWPVLIAGVVVALGYFVNQMRAVGEVADAAGVSLGNFKLLLKINPDAAARENVATYQALETRIKAVSSELEKLNSKVATDRVAWRVDGDDLLQIDRLNRELVVLKEKLGEADANFDSFNSHAQRVGRAATSGSDGLRKLANNAKAANDALVASGDPTGKQIKLYQELAAKLKNYDDLIKRAPEQEALLNRGKLEAVATLQKELAALNKVQAGRQRSVASYAAEESAVGRLNNIIAEYSSEQDDNTKVLKRLNAVQTEVNSIMTRYPKTVDAGKAATKLLSEAIARASDKFVEFNNAVKETLESLRPGNIDATKVALLQLGIALDEALDSGNSERAAEIVRAMETIELQSGNSASAADVLRDSNQQLADAAKEQSEAYANYWESAFNDIAGTLADFVADGMKDWKSFGKSLANIAKKIVADIIAEFLRLRVVNGMMNQLFGAMANGQLRPTGGGGGSLLGSLFGGSGAAGGAAGGNLGGLVSSALGIGGGLFGGFGVATGAAATSGAFAGAVASGSAGLGGAAALLGPIGMIVGAVALLTTLIKKDKPPDFRVGGTGGRVRGVEGSFSTAFGQVNAGSRLISWESLVEPMQQFDLGIQQLVTTIGGGQTQLDAITAALSTWSVDLRGNAATAENVLGSRFNAILTTFSADVQSFVGTAGTLEERVGRLTDALSIEAAVANGELGSTFASVSELLTNNRVGTEALSETYNRVLASVRLMDDAVLATGVSFDLTREEFISFSADMVTAAGGLERATSLWSAYYESFFSDSERAALTRSRATTAVSSEFSDIGLDAANFQGTNAMAQFRTLFTEMMPTLSAEAIVQWLEAGAALAQLTGLTETYNEVLDGSVESAGSLVDLMSTVDEQIASFDTNAGSFTERMLRVTSDMNLLISQAEALGASEFDLMRIRQLGMLRLNAIVQEQQQALNEYSSFVSQFATGSNSGLSEFQQSLVDIQNRARDAAAEANRLALAAGMVGANSSDLANIQMRAAEQMAAAALALESSIQDLAEQLGYFESAVTPARTYGDSILGFAHWLADQQSILAAAPVVDTERFNLATQLGRQIRELTEFTGESVLDVITRMRIPFNTLMADFGVTVASLNDPEVFDRLVTASRTLGIEITEAAARLGTNVGALSNASSPLNDAFERSIAKLPSAVGSQLTTLLRGIETAVGPEAQTSAARALTDFVNAQTPAIRAALAPFLDDVDTSSVQDQQLSAAEQSNRYLSAANEFLSRIAANTGTLTAAGSLGGNIGPVRPKTTESGDTTTHAILRNVVAALAGVEKELRARNMKTTVGVNSG